MGATGIQVGTPFAFCEESGMASDLKKKVLTLSRDGKTFAFTDSVASPTGFPFKVAQVGETLSEASRFQQRRRICDLGYLRHMYRKPDGSVGYRCPAEPIAHFLKKGGTHNQTVGRKCVCNGLAATVGIAQSRSGGFIEPPLVTAGDDLVHLSQFIPPGKESYSAADVLRQLLPAKVSS